MLKSIAPLYQGNVINVSAWKDEDKEGGRYRDYFAGANSYVTSNYGGYRGCGEANSFELDLEGSLPPQLHGKFDVVYNHTTLEHVFDVFTAVRNLCALSRDTVIVVVPFVQEVHVSESFSDYWRFTSPGLRKLFSDNGFATVFLASSPGRAASIYHLCVASRHPERWREKFQSMPATVNDGQALFRPSLLGRFIGRFAKGLSAR